MKPARNAARSGRSDAPTKSVHPCRSARLVRLARSVRYARAVKSELSELSAPPAKSTRAARVARTAQRGFTLIELVVVMAVIGLLLTLALPRYFHSIDRGKESVQRQNLSVMRDAIDKFYGDNGQYPDTLDDLVAKHYLRRIPDDPVSGASNWAIVASPDSGKPGVYDVAPAEAASGVPGLPGEAVAGAR